MNRCAEIENNQGRAGCARRHRITGVTSTLFSREWVEFANEMPPTETSRLLIFTF